MQGSLSRTFILTPFLFRGMGYPFDIILISTKWFEDTKNLIGGIAYPANKYGKVVYEAA